MITGIHHVAIIVSSEECVRFYERLGFSVTFRKNRSFDTVVLMEGYGLQLEIFIDPRHQSKGDTEPLGLRHIALKVEDVERTIEEMNLDAEAINRDWIGKRFCNVSDPDGNVIEFHE